MEPLRMVPNLIEQVHVRLVDAIADGTLAPNERLTQEELADRLSVSRQPVSHALQLLKRQGLVVEQGKRGLDRRAGRAALDPRPLPGSRRARRTCSAAGGRTDFQRPSPRRMRSTLSAQRFAAGRALGDDASIHDWIEADVAFHSSIYALSGNPAIAETVADRGRISSAAWAWRSSTASVRKGVWVEHVAIVRADSRRRSDGAIEAAVNHFEKAGARLYAELSAGEADARRDARRTRREVTDVSVAPSRRDHRDERAAVSGQAGRTRSDAIDDVSSVERSRLPACECA